MIRSAQSNVRNTPDFTGNPVTHRGFLIGEIVWSSNDDRLWRLRNRERACRCANGHQLPLWVVTYQES
jgi:hypothetical protein